MMAFLFAVASFVFLIFVALGVLALVFTWQFWAVCAGLMALCGLVDLLSRRDRRRDRRPVRR